MDGIVTVAIGIDVTFTHTVDGGRREPLLGGFAAGKRFTYRPNWGFPGWREGDQTAAPVLGFSREHIHPGDVVRAVIVPPVIDQLEAWTELAAGAELRLYEGPHERGRGTVLWVSPSRWPMPAADQTRFAQWLAKE
ncbi:hypothetical protein [Arthrobacter sp. Y-9]|uniref:hypothetical protein n=1 Tax=Arthrobacter sp. Y-9 TaxID=3039385 RepID=UPI00241C34CF|nr:hypothetical protein [Arthrobacter sp. Y-9]WFR85514.1 hypothetical protein P9849_07850 [Arthrobacter sp. Y-9]